MLLFASAATAAFYFCCCCMPLLLSAASAAFCYCYCQLLLYLLLLAASAACCLPLLLLAVAAAACCCCNPTTLLIPVPSLCCSPSRFIRPSCRRLLNTGVKPSRCCLLLLLHCTLHPAITAQARPALSPPIQTPNLNLYSRHMISKSILNTLTTSQMPHARNVTNHHWPTGPCTPHCCSFVQSNRRSVTQHRSQ